MVADEAAGLTPSHLAGAERVHLNEMDQRPSADAVKKIIASCLRESLVLNGFDPDSIPDDFDLRGRGVVDSLAFVQLIGALEGRFGCTLDLSDVTPTDLTRIGVLSRHIAAQLAARS